MILGLNIVSIIFRSILCKVHLLAICFNFLVFRFRSTRVNTGQLRLTQIIGQLFLRIMKPLIVSRCTTVLKEYFWARDFIVVQGVIKINGNT